MCQEEKQGSIEENKRLERAATCLQELIIGRAFEVTQRSLPGEAGSPLQHPHEGHCSCARTVPLPGRAPVGLTSEHPHTLPYALALAFLLKIPKGRLLVKHRVHLTF